MILFTTDMHVKSIMIAYNMFGWEKGRSLLLLTYKPSYLTGYMWEKAVQKASREMIVIHLFRRMRGLTGNV